MKASQAKERKTAAPLLFFDDLEDDGTDNLWSCTPDDTIFAFEGVDPFNDSTPEEKANAVDPLLWLRPEAQAKWRPFVTSKVKRFWAKRAQAEARLMLEVEKMMTARHRRRRIRFQAS